MIRPRKTKELIQLIFKSALYQSRQVKTIDDIVRLHFETWSDTKHQNREPMRLALNLLNQKPATIIETGTSAWGTDSTRLWDKYVRTFGGLFISVDIRPEASARLKFQTGNSTKLFVDDSVNFLSKNKEIKADLYYLDSWDLDLEDPLPSALHGLAEYQAISDRLAPNTLLLIDDTPHEEYFKSLKLPKKSQEFKEQHGVYPGKGAFIKDELSKKYNFEVLFHEYSLLLRIIE